MKTYGQISYDAQPYGFRNWNIVPHVVRAAHETNAQAVIRAFIRRNKLNPKRKWK